MKAWKIIAVAQIVFAAFIAYSSWKLNDDYKKMNQALDRLESGIKILDQLLDPNHKEIQKYKVYEI